MNIKLLLSLTCLLVTYVSAETVYKTVDIDGNIIFSDTPSEGAEQIEIRKSQTLDLPAPPSFESSSKRKQEKLVIYSNLQIVNPQDDATIHSNEGKVTVNVEMEPALIEGHQLVLYLDGKKIASGNSTTFTLNNIDRGTHQISINVVNADNKPIKESAKISFHLRRKSVLSSGEKKDSDVVTPLNPPKPSQPEVSPTNPPKPGLSTPPAPQPVL